MTRGGAAAGYCGVRAASRGRRFRRSSATVALRTDIKPVLDEMASARCSYVLRSTWARPFAVAPPRTWPARPGRTGTAPSSRPCDGRGLDRRDVDAIVRLTPSACSETRPRGHDVTRGSPDGSDRPRCRWFREPSRPRTDATSPIWRSGCQVAGVDGHCVVGGAGGWCGCGSRGGPAVRGVRDGWSCSYSGTGPRPLFVVPPPSKVERARPGVGAQATNRGVLYASRDGRGRLANRNGDVWLA